MNLVPKICVKSADFRQQRSMGAGKHVDTRQVEAFLPAAGWAQAEAEGPLDRGIMETYGSDG